MILDPSMPFLESDSQMPNSCTVNRIQADPGRRYPINLTASCIESMGERTLLAFDSVDEEGAFNAGRVLLVLLPRVPEQEPAL